MISEDYFSCAAVWNEQEGVCKPLSLGLSPYDYWVQGWPASQGTALSGAPVGGYPWSQPGVSGQVLPSVPAGSGAVWPVGGVGLPASAYATPLGYLGPLGPPLPLYSQAGLATDLRHLMNPLRCLLGGIWPSQ